MAGSSSTSATTTQTNTAINPIAFADNGATAINTINSGTGTVNNNVTTLDAQVASKSLDNMLTMGQDALLFGADAQRQAYGFGTNVLSFAQDNQKQTLAFAGSQTKAANATSMAAIESAGSSMDKALAFGARQTGVALDSLTQSASMIDTAYKDAKGVLSTNVILVAIGAGVLVVYFAMRKK